jgi:hypothetical protein
VRRAKATMPKKQRGNNVRKTPKQHKKSNAQTKKKNHNAKLMRKQQN